MRNVNDMFDKIDELAAIKQNFLDFADTTTTTFVRTVNKNIWNGIVTTTTWKILLDESKSKLCCRDGQGFKILDKINVIIERVDCSEGTKDLLLDGSKEDRIVATSILNVQAEKKYGSKK